VFHSNNKILNKKSRGFTLIELLVSIAIMGLLSSIVIASVSAAKTKSNTAKAKMEMNQIVRAITMAQREKEAYLLTITGSGCSDCSGRGGGDYRNTPTSNAFYIAWASAISKIELAANGLAIGISNITRDPWGTPYSLDENEGESGDSDCRYDILLSSGPDGISYTADDIFSEQIPHSKCP